VSPRPLFESIGNGGATPAPLAEELTELLLLGLALVLRAVDWDDDDDDDDDDDAGNASPINRAI